MPPETPKLIEIEVFRAGDYGEMGKYTRKDVQAMADDYKPSFHEAPVITDHRWDGPAFGWVLSLRRRGDTLLATLSDLAPELIQWIREGRYKKRSIGIYTCMPETGRPHLREVSFLGAAIPAVKGLKDIKLSEAFAGVPSVEIDFSGDDDADMDVVEMSEAAAVKKTEDGKEYPAAAFAYAPDTQKPATWAVRLWESPEQKVTRKQVGRAVAALSPGGLAGKRASIPRAALSDVKATVREAWIRVNGEKAEIPKWIQDAAAPELFYDDQYVEIAESAVEPDGSTILIDVIQSGFNADKSRFYSPDAIRKGHQLFRQKMNADHQTFKDESNQPEDSVRPTRWVANVKETWVKENGDGTATMQARAAVVEDWMRNKLRNLKEAGLLHEMGVSIRAIAKGVPMVIEGVKTLFVQEFRRARSVDFVTTPGAGGRVLALESDGSGFDVDLVTEARLRELRPDLVQAIEESATAQFELEAEAMKTVEELQAELQATQTKLNEVTIQHADVSKQLETAQRESAQAQVQSAMEVALAKCSDLPEPAKKRVRKALENATDAKCVESAIESERAYLKELKAAPAVRNLGESTAPASDGGAQEYYVATRESYIRRGMTPEEADRKAKIVAGVK